MKTIIPLSLVMLTLASFSFTGFAGTALLSPRARDHQTRTVAATDTSANTVLQNRNAIASPRALDNQIKTVAGTSNDADTLACSRKMVASPKAIGECVSHPLTCAAMPCCAVASK